MWAWLFCVGFAYWTQVLRLPRHAGWFSVGCGCWTQVLRLTYYPGWFCVGFEYLTQVLRLTRYAGWFCVGCGCWTQFPGSHAMLVVSVWALGAELGFWHSHAMLVVFSILTQMNSYLGRENFNWKDTSIRMACKQVCGMLSWLMIYVTESCSLQAVPPKNGWSWVEKGSRAQAIHKEQGSELQSSMISASIPTSESLPWAPTLTSLNDGLHL